MGGGMGGWGRGGNSVGGHMINLVDGVGVISLGVLTDGINQSPETLIQLIGSQTIVQGFFAIAREAGRTIVREGERGNERRMRKEEEQGERRRRRKGE